MPPITEQDVHRIYQDSLPVTRANFKAAFDNVVKLVRTAIADLNAHLDKRFVELEKKDQELSTKVEKMLRGKDGYTPQKNKDYFDGNAGYTPIKGKDYFDGKTPVAGVDFQIPQTDEDAIVNRIASDITPKIIAEIEQRIPSFGPAIRDSLKLLPEGDRPHVSLFAGLEQHVQELLKKHGQYLPSGGAAVSVMQSGTLKAQSAAALNFKGGGAPTVTIGANGVTNIDFPTAGGFTTLAATETPDGSTTVFTFTNATAQPSFIIVDNVWLRATTKKGTVNWTWASGTKKATFAVPPVDEVLGIV